MRDLTLRTLVLVAALVQIVFPFFVNPFRDNVRPIQASEPSQLEPAGYAFSIWGAIYLGAVAYAIWQLTPSGRADPATVRIAPLAIMIYVGSSAWLASAKFGPVWATMPILAAMAGCAVVSLWFAQTSGAPSIERTLCMIAPFALYAGWTLCATFVNIAEVAPRYGFTRFGLSIPGYAILSIGVLTAAVAGVLWLTQANLLFAATVIWALIAILVVGYQRQADPAVMAALGVALLAVVAMTIWLRILARA